jgi:hypothetical protein
MTRQRTTRFVLAGLAVLAAAACADSNSSTLTPRAPALSAGSAAKVKNAAGRVHPVSRSFTRSIDVDFKGGEIRIDEVGLRVKVPKQAIRPQEGTIHMSVTVLAGDQIAYEFQPSGITFQRPLQFEQDLRDLADAASRGDVPQVSYFKSTQDLDPVHGVARTYEDLTTDIDLSGHTVKADIWHFSGYIVSWGRR